MPRAAAFFFAGLVLAVLALHAAWTPPLPRLDRLLRTADGAVVSLAQTLPDLLGAEVVFVGELHDQPAHHWAQLQLIQAFHEAELPVAVGLEMFRADGQALLDRWVAGEIEPTDFVLAYYDHWNFPWAYYGAIFTYAREHGIPLVGLNVPPETVRKVAQSGFASLGPEAVAALPPVRCDVDEVYEGFIRKALGMHQAAGRAFTNFCEAQLLWDAAMAENLLAYRAANPGVSLVVLAGSGHAWKRGIPAQMARLGAAPVTRVVLPELPGRADRTSVVRDDADYLWLDLPVR